MLFVALICRKEEGGKKISNSTESKVTGTEQNKPSIPMQINPFVAKPGARM